MMPESVVCPVCKLGLTQKGKTLCCEQCELEGTYDEGIYDFIGNYGPYWGEILPEEMEGVLQRARVKGWRVAATEIGFKYPRRNEYILSNARIDWLFHCLDFSKTGACLDLGSGWGAIAFGLAKYYDEVWSLEAVKQRIAFQKIRQEQDNVANIKFVRSDWLRLPFADSYFDLIVANGVLEWVGLSDYSRNPREVQLEFLKELKRVLKPSGCLYIGIENRFGLQSLLGSKDHSGLPFTSLLPRKLADLTVKLYGKAGEYRQWGSSPKWKDYRTYTYSLWGYHKILKEAGFGQIVPYWTLCYNNPKYAGRFYGESFAFLLKFWRANAASGKTTGSLLILIGAHLPRWVVRIGLPLICPDFLIYAYKGERQEPFESELLRVMGRPNFSFVRIGGSKSVTSKITYFLLDQGKLFSVLKFPRFCGPYVGCTELEEAKMSQFNRLDIRKQIVGPVDVFVEPPIIGVQPQLYNPSHNHRILDWLLDFQRKTEKGYWNLQQLEGKLTVLSDFLSDVPMSSEVRFRTRQRIELFAKSLQQVKFPVTSEHGDFSTVNMFIGEDGQLYVVDWEFYQEEGEPLFDFVFFLCSCARGVTLKTFEDNFLGKGRYSLILRTLIAEFAREKGWPPKLILEAVPYILLRCLHRAATGPDNKHLALASYLQLLVIWDKVCRSNYYPYTLHT